MHHFLLLGVHLQGLGSCNDRGHGGVPVHHILGKSWPTRRDRALPRHPSGHRRAGVGDIS